MSGRSSLASAPLSLERVRETSPAVTRSLTPFLSSARTGIVSDLRTYEPGAGELEDAAGVVSVTGRLAGGTVVGSSAFDVELAFTRALGEAVERYAIAIAPRWLPSTQLHVDEALEQGALDPRALALPSDDERAAHPDFAAFDPAATIAWLAGGRLERDGTPTAALVPAQAALASYAVPAGEPRFTWASSSGVGAGNTLAEAVRSGLREVLERDAFALAWLRGRPLPHIDLDRVADPDVARWRDHHRRRGRAPALVWLANDLGLPVVAAHVVENEPFMFVPGFGAALRATAAMRRAVEEGEQGRYLVKHLFRQQRAASASAAPSGHPLEEQLLRWQDPARFEELSHLVEPSAVLDPSTLPDLARATPREDVEQITTMVHRAGLDAFVVDLTPPDLRARFPLRVAAVVVPGAQPVQMGPKPWCLENPRIGLDRSAMNAQPPPFA